MSGTLYLIGEIVAFMAAATVLGFILGRVSRRSRPSLNTAELTVLRERSSLLETEVDELTAALTQARVNAAGPDGTAQGRAAMAEREAEGLERRLREAAVRIRQLEQERDEWVEIAELAEADAPGPAGRPEGTDQPSDTVETSDLAALQAELARRTAQIAHLEQVAGDAHRLEDELAARDDRIGHLEAALEANAAARASSDVDAAAIGVSLGAGEYADALLEFDAWDQRDET